VGPGGQKRANIYAIYIEHGILLCSEYNCKILPYPIQNKGSLIGAAKSKLNMSICNYSDTTKTRLVGIGILIYTVKHELRKFNLAIYPQVNLSEAIANLAKHHAMIL
jgi:hypothetical protein